MSLLERDAVVKVRKILTDAGLEGVVVELTETARSAEEAANSIDCELGAIVKSLVFKVSRRSVMALVAGDYKCIEGNLPAAFNLEGVVTRPNAAEVKCITGFSIGGVAPIGLLHPLPMVIDRSLKRFDTVYAAAGHPHCVFGISVADLGRITGGIISTSIAEPMNPKKVAAGGRKAGRSFAEEELGTSGRD